MAALTTLERAALEAILAEQDDDRDLLAEQLRRAVVTKRENTGGGFYTDLAVPDADPLQTPDMHRGVDVWISVEGMDHGLGMILHYKDGLPYLLEGYAVGVDDTSAVEFENVRFALTEHPSQFNPDRG